MTFYFFMEQNNIFGIFYFSTVYVFLQFLVLTCGDFYILSNNVYYVGVVTIIDTLFSKYIMYISNLVINCK